MSEENTKTVEALEEPTKRISLKEATRDKLATWWDKKNNRSRLTIIIVACLAYIAMLIVSFFLN